MAFRHNMVNIGKKPNESIYKFTFIWINLSPSEHEESGCKSVQPENKSPLKNINYKSLKILRYFKFKKWFK